MSVSIQLPIEANAVINLEDGIYHEDPGATVQIKASRALVLGFTASAALGYEHNLIQACQLILRTPGSAELQAAAITGPWDELTVTADTIPDTGPSVSATPSTGGIVSFQMQTGGAGQEAYAAKAALYGAQIMAPGGRAVTIYTKMAPRSYRPYILLTVDETQTVALQPQGYPASGYIDPSQDNALTWSNAATGGACLSDPQQASATVSWRPWSGGEAQTIQVTGIAQSVTIPAGTFPAGGIEWMIEVTDNLGNVTASPWYRLETGEVLSKAMPLQPVSEVVDGYEPITFAWQHIISTGTAPTGSELQISTDGETWQALQTITGAAQEWTAQPGTLPSGESYWRVRTYNRSGAAGRWSQAAAIVVIAAPEAPSVTATNEPRTTITWSAPEQEAYEIQVDGQSTGPKYGQARSYRAESYLPDGAHTVAVRVQNAYGLWSTWGTWTITVANVQGPEITLTVQEGESPALSWTAGDYDAFWVYRDGEQIATVTGASYQDLLAPAGSHQYRVRGVYDASGNYGLSERVTASAQLAAVILTDLLTGQAMRCPYALRGQTAIARSMSQAVEYIHYSGSVLPTAQIGPEQTRGYTFRPTFPAAMAAQADELEAMTGRAVHARDKYGAAVFAVIDSISVESTHARRSYNVRLTEIQATEKEVTAAWSTPSATAATSTGAARTSASSRRRGLPR